MMRGTPAGPSAGPARLVALALTAALAACSDEKPVTSWTGDLIIKILGNGTVRSTLAGADGLQRIECRGKGGTTTGGCTLQTTKADKGLGRPDLLVVPDAGFEFRGWSSGDSACNADAGANLQAVRLSVVWGDYFEDRKLGTASYRNECVAVFQSLSKPRPPAITGAIPGAGAAGTEVLVAGENLGGARSAVEFEGVFTHVISGSETELRTVVPVEARPAAVALILWTPTGKATAPQKFLVGGTPGDGGASDTRIDLGAGSKDGRPLEKGIPVPDKAAADTVPAVVDSKKPLDGKKTSPEAAAPRP